MKTLSEKLDELTQEIHQELLAAIEASEIRSKHVDEKCIPVDIFGYTELTVVSNQLSFLDDDGYRYSLDCDCQLEDLIDILNHLENV